MKKIVLGGLLTLAAFSTSFAQNSDNEWSVGLQLGSTHFQGENVNEIINFDGIHGMIGVQASKYINPFFDFQFGLKHGQVDGPDFYTNLFDFNALLKFKFSNGAIFKENSLIAPYVFAGFGDAVSESKNLTSGLLTKPNAHFNLPVGFGIDINLSEKWKVSLETHYNYAMNDGYDFSSDNDRGDSFLFNSVGVAYNFSCKKDADGDGVADKDDACPDVAGLLAFNGCPDTDNDGFVDSKDNCPKVAGKVEGCPDTDGDGILDKNDDCPNVAGTLKGCPDTDKDGVADKDDKCPKTAGVVKHNGCPDSDNDGIIDSKDQCPTVFGTVNGCLDTDKDGVADKDDKCPTIAGKIELNGCLLSAEEQQTIQSAAEHILFASGSTKIKSQSYADLDKLAEILKNHNEVKASIEGHTDNTGKAESNLKLSKGRAASVKQYLISKGVKADHLSSEGYGQTKPIADNSTPEGRTENRRVVVVTTSYQK